METMDHIAIMKKSWGLTGKILTGEKTAESRWYKSKYAPWNRIRVGDTIYFKDSGKPVTIKAKVKKVFQFDKLTSLKTKEILDKWGRADLGTGEMTKEIQKYTSNKNYCILIFFDKVKKIKPFAINKTGFGAMSSWISTGDINKIKRRSA